MGSGSQDQELCPPATSHHRPARCHAEPSQASPALAGRGRRSTGPLGGGREHLEVTGPAVPAGQVSACRRAACRERSVAPCAEGDGVAARRRPIVGARPRDCAGGGETHTSVQGQGCRAHPSFPGIGDTPTWGALRHPESAVLSAPAAEITPSFSQTPFATGDPTYNSLLF